MPVYEYRCRACGEPREVIQPMHAERPTTCAECGGELRRVWGRVGVRFSGWGFAATDALIPDDRPRRDFATLKDRAERLMDSDPP